MARISGYELNAGGVVVMFFVLAGIQAAEYLALYLLRGIAAYKMAKRMGIKNAWLAFIPCGCFYLIGKLQDESGAFSKSNNVWALMALISSAIYATLAIAIDAISTIPTLVSIISTTEMTDIITDASIVSSTVSEFLPYPMYFAGLAFTVSSLFIYMNVYRAYSPKMATRFSIIAVAVSVVFNTDILFAIFLFTMRNKERVSYADYVKDKMGDFGRYYGPFGGYGNGGTNKYYDERRNSPPPKREEDPFSEFSNGDDVFTDKNGNGFGESNTNYTYKDPTSYGNDKDDDLF